MEKLLKLNIQLFAEEGETSETSVSTETATTDKKESETLSFTDLLSKNPEYQREFDKLVDKSLNTAKTNWKKDYDAKMEKERTEAEKLAKMDAEQKIQYELEKANNEKAELKSQLDAINLYKTASDIATERELPIGYLDLVDFTKETADTINSKIDKIVELRQKDLDNYLKTKLKQDTPTEKTTKSNVVDPYLEGFNSDKY